MLKRTSLVVPTCALLLVALAPSVAFAAHLSSDWQHANIVSVKSTSSSSFKLKVDVWDIDASKAKRLTFTAKKKSCGFYIAKTYFAPTFSKVSYKTFASYVTDKRGAVCDVKYIWRTNSQGDRYRVAQTVWADGFWR